MATTADETIGIVTKGSSPLLSKRVTINVAGVETIVTQAMLDTITYQVYDIISNGPEVEITDGPQTLAINAVIDDTPPTSDLLDDMNFSFQLDGSLYLTRRNRCRDVRETFTILGGESLTKVHRLWT